MELKQPSYILAHFLLLSFKVKAYDKILDPIYALTIKDSKGQQIYGQNTFLAKIPALNLEKGDSCELIFQTEN